MSPGNSEMVDLVARLVSVRTLPEGCGPLRNLNGHKSRVHAELGAKLAFQTHGICVQA